LKLTLSQMRIVVERRYELDEPVVVEVPMTKYLATEFITVTRTYEYGEIEQEFLIRGKELRKDGKPKAGLASDITLYAPSGRFADLLPDPRAAFIEALNDAID
jgi:hypothetical protein